MVAGDVTVDFNRHDLSDRVSCVSAGESVTGRGLVRRAKTSEIAAMRSEESDGVDVRQSGDRK